MENYEVQVQQQTGKITCDFEGAKAYLSARLDEYRNVVFTEDSKKDKVGSTGEVARWWQTRCNEILGGNQDTDGRYGKTARTETIKLQKKLNLTADGKAGYNSLQAAFYN